MKLVSLSAACFFVSVVSAFAGSDHYNAEQANRPPTAVDSTHTSSILESVGVGPRQTVRKPVASGDEGRRFWGR